VQSAANKVEPELIEHVFLRARNSRGIRRATTDFSWCGL